MTTQPPKPRVTVIVPAYNEEGNIAEFVRQFGHMRSQSGLDAELLYIDDGSSDNTHASILRESAANPWVRVIRHQRNRGLTEALQTGFDNAHGSIYVFYPADLQYLPAEIPRLVQPIIDDRADIVTGWKQGKYKKNFVSQIYNGLSRWIFDLQVHDLNSVKGFKREIVERIFLRQDWHRYLVVLAANEGYRVAEEKVTLHDRTWGESKFSIWRIPVGVLDMLAVKFQLTFLRKPLLYFGYVGLVFLLLALVVGVYAGYQRYFLGHGDRAFLYLVLLLVGVGMSLFLLGFLSEGQTAIREELTDLRRQHRRLETKLREREDS